MVNDPRQFRPRQDDSCFVPYALDLQNPHPLLQDRMVMVKDITGLYAGKQSEGAMRHYHEISVYDGPFNFCGTRYKIAGQWYGLPKAFKELNPKEFEVVRNEPGEVTFKLRQEYTFKGIGTAKVVDLLITLKLDPNEEEPVIKHYKGQWSKQDYSHEGLGYIFKELNGNHLAKITNLLESLKSAGDIKVN